MLRNLKILLRNLPLDQVDDDDNQKEKRWNDSPSDFPEPSWFLSKHQFDVPAEVFVSVDPHEADDFPEGNEEYTSTRGVCIHDIQDVLSSIGGTRQAQ